MGRKSTNDHFDDNTVNLIIEMTAIVREEVGLNECFASDIAAAIVNGMKKRFPGQEIYIAKNNSNDLLLRNRGICKAFTGTAQSRDALLLEHGISKSTFYRIINDPKSRKLKRLKGRSRPIN